MSMIWRFLFCIISVFLSAHADASDQCTSASAAWDYWKEGKVRGANVFLDIAANNYDWSILKSSWKVNTVRLQLILTDEQLQAIAERGIDSQPSLKNKIQLFFSNAEKNNIFVVLDLHRPEGGAVGNSAKFWRSTALQENFFKVWLALLDEVSGYQNLIGLDLLNEPTPEAVYKTSYQQRKGSSDDWMLIADNLIKKIRQKYSCIPLIVESVDWAKPFRFREMKVFDDPYVVYSAHMYAPFEVTHQGINQFPKNNSLRRYGISQENIQKFLTRNLQEVRKFQCLNKKPIYIGEFGINYFADPQDRQLYISTLLEIFEQYGWSWTYHAYRIWDGWMPDAKMLSLISDSKNIAREDAISDCN